jgi:catechol 2,3-dioxygenase-like lactoylglutathione lyase family enzyme
MSTAIREVIDKRRMMEGVDNVWPDMVEGIAHLAFVTDDMEATMEFWTTVMKMQLVAAKRVPTGLDEDAAERGEPPFSWVRHYFFSMGKDQMVAFFEYPKEANVPKSDRDHIGGMQHVAFRVPAERFDAMCDHVKSCGISVKGPMAVGKFTKAFYFFDNNGLRLEINTYRDDSPRKGNVGPCLNNRDEAEKELKTMFDDPEKVRYWLDRMPLDNR